MATWFITCCSTGLGRALAASAVGRGETVVLTARNPTAIDDLAASCPDTAFALALDVSDGAQCRTAVDSAVERFGGIDVLVNYAGQGYRATVEEANDEQVRELSAAAAIITAMRSPTPPRRLVLGPDALAWFHRSIEGLSPGVDAWRHTSLGTSFPEGS